MINKRLINTGVEAEAAFDALANFETVTYTGNGGTQKITGYIRKGAAFNGSSSYIDLGTSSALNTFNGEQSISVWIRPTTSTHQEILGYRNDSTLQWNYLEKMSDNTIRFLLRQSSSPLTVFQTTGTVSLNQWNHIVVTVNSTTAKIYINNGTAETSASTVTSFSNSETTRIGYFDSLQGVNYFNGSIDQVRIFNKALSSGEVTTLYGETYASSTKSTTDIFGDGSGVALYELDEDANDTGGTYNGTPTNVNFLGMAFQPDLVWIKNRTSTAAHAIFDSVRGATKYLTSNGTGAEATYTNTLTSFDSNGFSVDFSSGVNGLGNDYVAWCFKGGGTAVSNTDGSITSTVSANPDAGFSIVKYTGDRTSGTNQTVGHGLSSPPELVIAKRLTGSMTSTNGYWAVYSSGLSSASYYLKLNETAAEFNDSAVWGGVAPTSSVFTIRDAAANNFTGESHIAYCFHSVDGYQKVGSYTGGGEGSSNEITTGFKPRWVMVKRTDDTGTWRIYDYLRGVVNDTTSLNLSADSSGAESTPSSAWEITFTDTGFYWGTGSNVKGSINATGGTYIYLAIA